MAFAQVVTHLAVATPFLLLSSCHSLHVIEDGHGPRDTLIFGTHHKTGTELAKRVSACFDSSFKYTLDSHWAGKPLRRHLRVLHFTRNPISLALSGYLYHKETGEDWTLKPGYQMESLAKDPILRQYLTNRSESYTEFLRRVNAHIGIRAEIAHMNAELDQLETADASCRASTQCKQVCLEDFTKSSFSYDASWRKVMTFMGKRITPEIKRCLTKEDLNRHPQDSGHVTSNSFPEWTYNSLRDLVVKLDADAYNSRLKKMGEGSLNCGARNFLHTPAVSNATAGSEYPGWLIEETYA